MYGYGNWIIKKAECRRIIAFKLWCWRRLLRVFLTLKFIGRMVAEAEAAILRPPDVKN